jgi:hypothetical protein
MGIWHRPLIRRPVLFGIGFLVAAGAGMLFQPYWLDLCNRINTREYVAWNGRPTVGRECSPVSGVTMSGNFLIGFGVFMLIIGPIIFSLLQIRRRGYNWESSRVETATSNLPMLSGIIYIVSGFGLAMLGS